MLDLKPQLQQQLARAGSKRKAPQLEPDEHDQDHDQDHNQDMHHVSQQQEEPEQAEEDEDEEEEPRRAGEGYARAAPLVRDTNGYVTGSIVRIACVNFVTYNAVQFSPGPDLNMIIGPNGTGKSTIACAIAIGLGFPPSVLGRQAKISGFVKTGHKEGSVEIELKGHIGKPNVVIRRQLHSINEKSSFSLDGESATAAQVKEKIGSLNVQVNNLCTFLPQDRVASFAAMSNSELLRETQRAAGAQNLSTWHEQLIVDGKALKGLEQAFESSTKSLAVVREKNARAEREVAAFHERAKIEHNLIITGICLTFAEYTKAFEDFTAKKEERNVLNQARLELEEANKPFVNSERGLKGVVQFCEAEKTKLTKSSIRAIRDVNEKAASLTKSNDEVNKIEAAIKTIKKEEQLRKKTISSLQMDVSKLQRIVDNMPEEGNLLQINKEMASTVELRGPLAAKEAEHAEATRMINQELSMIDRNFSRAKEHYAKLNNVSNQREQQLARGSQIEKQCYAALLWFRENKANFKGRAYEPVRLLINAKNTQYADIAEAPITFANSLTFVFELKEDYDFMAHHYVDAHNNNRANIAYLPLGTTYQSMIDKRDANFSRESLRALGFDCWHTDLIDGPDMILAFLCSVLLLEKIPVKTSKGQVDFATIEQKRSFKRFYTQDASHSIKYSSYGKRGAQQETRHLTPSYYLKTSEDTTLIKECTETLKDLEGRKRQKGQALQNLREEHKLVEVELAEIADQLTRMGKEREALKAPMITWRQAGVKLASKAATLKAEREKPNSNKREFDFRKKLEAYTEKRLRLVLQHKDLQFKVAEIVVQLVEVGLRLAQATVDLRAMSQVATTHTADLVAKKLEHEAAKLEVIKLNQIAKALYEPVKAYEEGDQEILAEANTRRVEQQEGLEQLLEAQEMDQERLAGISNVSRSVIAAWEGRKLEIAELEKKTATAGEQLEKTRSSIATIQSKWKPALQFLVSAISQRFGKAFDIMNRLGEVVIAEHEDFDKWGIEIRCSFRDNEPLRKLTAQRQSGGERALATVMYLMSLAELGKSPFSLVDEINQGMDQRVERQVHNQLVATTCKDDVGQYFLITPKLLPGLDYHEKMRVLIIHNGDWLPPILNIDKIISNKQDLNRRLAKASLAPPRALATH